MERQKGKPGLNAASAWDSSSKPSARSGAFVSLLFKAVVIGVLGFAAWQEWQQHIIWQTQIAAEQAQKLKAEADAAAALNEAQVRKLEAEAAVAKQLNDAQAQKLRAEADAAKALNDAQVKKLESEAAVAKEVNEAQAEKLKAEAGVAEQVAAGAKAKSCSERMQLMTQNMYVEDFGPNGTVKPGTPTARMIEKYNKEC